MVETNDEQQGMSPWAVPSTVMRFRWAFEPLVAVLFFAVWLVLSLLLGDARDLSVILLLALSIAFSRISPIGALAFGAVALATGVFGTSVTAAAWAYCVAGVVVCFGAPAHGSRIARWVGLAGAIALAAAIGMINLSEAFNHANQGIGGIWGAMAAALIFLLSVQVQVGLVLGAWAVGLTLNGRARRRTRLSRANSQQGESPAFASPGLPAWTGFERALMGGDRDESDSVQTQESRVFRSVTYRQLSADIAVAVVFAVILFLSPGDHVVPEYAVGAGFAVALAFRRIAPSVALALAWASALAQVGLGIPVLTANFAILAVLYATAAYGGRLLKWIGLASVGLGALIAAVYLSGLIPARSSLLSRTESFAADVSAAPDLAGLLFRLAGVFIASVGVLGLSWTLGLLIRTWQNAILSRRQEVHAVEEQRIAQRSVVVEQERNRIARDMHDVVAHSLAVVIAQADGARYARAGDPHVVDAALTTISATARDALADVRILLTQLRQQEASGPQPVLADLDRLIEQMRGTGLAIVWTTTGIPQSLGSGAQLALYRIIQEALTNALRHGNPDHRVHLAVNWEERSVTTVVTNAARTDRTFDERAGVGHGLPGMRERALLAGGTLETTLIDGTFTVTAVLPIIQAHPIRAGAPAGDAPRPPVKENS